MDKDRIKGKLEGVKGRVKRQAGEWTGNEEAQAEGAMDQAKGKAQNAFGKAKDTARDMADKVRQHEKHDESDLRHDRDIDERAA